MISRTLLALILTAGLFGLVFRLSYIRIISTHFICSCLCTNPNRCCCNLCNFSSYKMSCLLSSLRVSSSLLCSFSLSGYFLMNNNPKNISLYAIWMDGYNYARNELEGYYHAKFRKLKQKIKQLRKRLRMMNGKLF